MKNRARLVWEDPPPRKPPTGRPVTLLTDEQQAQLRARPGVWARLNTYQKIKSCSGAANSLKKRVGPGWEIITRRHGTGSAIYARWVGTE